MLILIVFIVGAVPTLLFGGVLLVPAWASVAGDGIEWVTIRAKILSDRNKETSENKRQEE